MTNNRAEQRLLSMGRTLIRWRVTAAALVAVMTAFFGYHALQLRLVSRFDELLPATHPFIQVHRKFAKTFGGANTVLIMLRVRQGDRRGHGMAGEGDPVQERRGAAGAGCGACGP